MQAKAGQGREEGGGLHGVRLGSGAAAHARKKKGNQAGTGDEENGLWPRRRGKEIRLDYFLGIFG